MHTREIRLRVDKNYLPMLFVLMTLGFMITGIIISSNPVVCNAAADWGTLTTGIDSLCNGAYSNLVTIIRPIAVVTFAIAGIAHFGMPGSTLERRLQGWPMKIIFALALIGFAPTVVDIIIAQCQEAGLFSFI